MQTCMQSPTWRWSNDKASKETNLFGECRYEMHVSWTWMVLTTEQSSMCGDCISVGIEPVIPSWRCWSRKTHSWPLLWHAVGVIPLMLTDLLAGMQRFFDETYIELCFFSLHACFGFRKSCIVFLLWSVHSEFSALLGYFFYS